MKRLLIKFVSFIERTWLKFLAGITLMFSIAVVVISITCKQKSSTLDILLALCLSYLASWMLYILIQLLPQRKRTKKALKIVDPLLSKASQHMALIIKGVLFLSGIDRNLNFFRDDDAEKLKIFYIGDDSVYCIKTTKEKGSWGKSVWWFITQADFRVWHDAILKNIEKITALYTNLPFELITVLAQISSMNIIKAIFVEGLDRPCIKGELPLKFEEYIKLFHKLDHFCEYRQDVDFITMDITTQGEYLETLSKIDPERMKLIRQVKDSVPHYCNGEVWMRVPI